MELSSDLVFLVSPLRFDMFRLFRYRVSSIWTPTHECPARRCVRGCFAHRFDASSRENFPVARKTSMTLILFLSHAHMRSHIQRNEKLITALSFQASRVACTSKFIPLGKFSLSSFLFLSFSQTRRRDARLNRMKLQWGKIVAPLRSIRWHLVACARNMFRH